MEPNAKQATTTSGVNGEVNASDEIHFRALALGHESRLLLGQSASRMQKHLLKEADRVLERENVEQKRHNIRRTRRDDLGVAADDDCVRVVACVAPAPDRRLAHDHETGDLIDRVVHPLRLEGGAMAALVPAAVGRRAVENAINDEERNCGPAPPEIIAEAPRHDERGKPDKRVPDRRDRRRAASAP